MIILSPLPTDMPQSTIAQWLRGSKTPTEPATSAAHAPHIAPTEPSDTYKIPLPDSNGPSDGLRPVAPAALFQRKENLPVLPPNVTIMRCSKDHIKSFHRLNALLLPIQYPDAFYKETLEDEVIASITRVVLWTPTDSLRNGNSVVDQLPSQVESEDKVVAGIRCRLLASPPHMPSTNEPNLYISTIGVLAPFRQLSLGSHLLEEIFQVAVDDYGLTTVYAHVWEANEDGLEWYLKRGFTILRQEVGYYRKLAPRTDAWLIKRDIG